MGRISLVYDGGTPDHLETVFPELENRRFLATFFIDPTMLLDDLPDWRRVSQLGHEVGNGCLLGNCLPDGTFPAWTSEMIRDDVVASHHLFQDLLELDQLPVGLPFGSRQCADREDYLTALPKELVYRTGEIGVNEGSDHGGRLKALPVSNLKFANLKETVDKNFGPDNWLILSFAGIGSGAKSIDAAVHREFLDFLNSGDYPLCPLVSAHSVQAQDSHVFHIF